MPELPEVEVVRRGLERRVVGGTIAEVSVLHPRAVRRHAAGPADFAASLAGRRISSARRRGKYLWLPLDNGDALLAHLGMSGQLLVRPACAPPERHLRVRFSLDRPATGPAPGSCDLRFVDQRTFGAVAVSAGGAALPREISHIARDPLDCQFDDEAFASRVRRRTSGIKLLLLDQRLASGVGNIYADEALWRAGVHAEHPGHRLRRSEVAALLSAIRQVMSSALAQGGTSFDALYVDVNGESGYFERSLEVYGRAGRACSRCGASIIRVPFLNRSSYYCPSCQRLPRRRPARVRCSSAGQVPERVTPG